MWVCGVCSYSNRFEFANCKRCTEAQPERYRAATTSRWTTTTGSRTVAQPTTTQTTTTQPTVPLPVVVAAPIPGAPLAPLAGTLLAGAPLPGQAPLANLPLVPALNLRYRLQTAQSMHCIIQWYSENEQRPQRNFGNANPASHVIEPDALELSHEDFFGSGANSFKINHTTAGGQILNGRLTTDLFLYGHSTKRAYGDNAHDGTRTGKGVRGISVNRHYVSAGKVAAYLEEVAGAVKTGSLQNRLRIWLLSCHAAEGMEDFHEKLAYGEHLARKLSERGWRDKQLIGFYNQVNHYNVFPLCRDIAARTALYAPLNLGSLTSARPHLWKIDGSGNVKMTRASGGVLIPSDQCP